MPIRTCFDTDRRLVRFEASGVFSIGEILEAISDALSDPAFEKGFDVLSDHSRIERVITAPEVEVLTRFLSGFKGLIANSKWAVVTRQAASYGMMRMLSVYMEDVPVELRIFGSEDEALSWLRPRDRK